MRKWKRRLTLLSAAIVSLIIAYVMFSFIFLDLSVDSWWFRSLNYEKYFLLRLFYRYMIFIGVAFSFFLIFFLNFWIASRYLGKTASSSEGGESVKKGKYRDLVRKFRSGSLRIYTPLSLILAIPIALPLYEKWEMALLWFFGAPSGIKDPAFGKDISYYLFSFPVYTLIQNKLLITFSSLFLFILLLYLIEKRLLSKESKAFPRGAKIHLSILVFLILFIQSWGFLLERYTLLYTNDHQPNFYGPGFLEMSYSLPLIWLSLISLCAAGLSLIASFYTRKGIPALVISGVCLLIIIGVQQSSFLPEAITQYIVEPNKRNREKPFIENSIQATLAAYNLNDVKTLEYDILQTTDRVNTPEVQQNIRNFPVWDKELLDSVYTQLQGIRSYYTFPSVDVDRYTVGGLYQQVYLASRELNLTKLPQAARNWENTHMQYSHGHGVVMTPAAQGGKEPMTWFIHNLELKSDYGFIIDRPGIYYGLEDYSYCIVPNKMGEIGYYADQTEVMQNYQYQGTGGVPLSSIFQKFLFSIYFKDIQKIFFNPNITKESQILFRRNILERIKTITPYFLLDADPYIVVTPKGLFWIQDAYTVSDQYPNTEYCTIPIGTESGIGRQKINYIRNSVKIIVDAYNGTVDYYISDPKDPIVNTYKRIYPGLLKDFNQMPEEFRKHIRYPKDIFEVQMKMYAKYHQTQPELFYQQDDAWEFASINAVPMEPYYLTTRMPESKGLEFLLVSPLSPVGRNNLRALAIAGCDGDNYGKISIYSFTKERQIDGPAQISALIDQDPNISQQLTLWDQRGSQVKRGRMMLLPIDKSILYIQSVYLSSATGAKIPELARIIVSQGDMVAMEMTVEEALEKVQAKIDERIERIKNRYPVPATEAPAQPVPVDPLEKPVLKDEPVMENPVQLPPAGLEAPEQPQKTEGGKSPDDAPLAPMPIPEPAPEPLPAQEPPPSTDAVNPAPTETGITSPETAPL